MLNGIDVSSNQPANICDLVSFDFAIVKATGNPKSMKWNYSNEYMVQQVESALNKTGCAGLYHFTHGGQSAETEADFFLSKVEKYIGRVILIIDYENKATENGREWLRSFIKRIKEKAGVNPVIYASSSVIKAQNLVGLCQEENCGIWSANYWAGSKAINGYNTSGLKMDIAESAIWQYTENGYLSGYNSKLDLDVFYGDKEQWLAYCSSSGYIPTNPSDGSKIAEDGYWGIDTTRALQRYLKTPEDGLISGQDSRDLNRINGGGLRSSSWQVGKGGSKVITELQKIIGANADGYFGYDSCGKLQLYLGTEPDHYVSSPSKMVRELQRRINNNSL